MAIDIDIDFENNPNGVFYAGQSMRGTVRLSVSEEKNVRGVYIRIYGKAYCKWSTGSGKNRRTYVGEEIYLNETTYLIGHRDGDIRLMPGTQTYNFQCNLPDRLPTSVEGNVGYIRYTARVTVDIPMAFDKELKRRFTVIRALNLNDNPQLKRPITAATSEMDCCSTFCCCFCICMNPIEVSAYVPVGGYTSGQVINLQLHVKHQGDPKDYEFTVELKKRIDYYAENQNALDCCDSGGHHKKESLCVTQKYVTSRISNTTSPEIVRVNLQVPPVPPTDFNSSSVVKVTYFLKITSSTGCCNGSPTNKIPITIGTYPIDDFAAPNTNATAPIIDQPTAPLLDSANGTTFDTELPTYEEAMDIVDGPGSGTGAGANADASGDNPAPPPYRPKYPVFKRTTSYSSGN